MKTRLLESKEHVRATVASVRLLEKADGRLLFQTSASPMNRPDTGPEGEAVFARLMQKVGRDLAIEGRLALDVLSDSMIRVRYNEGDTIVRNDTAMVVGAFDGPDQIEVDEQDDKVTITTAAGAIIVSLNPFAIEARDPTGKKIYGIGGPEKNNFGQWDQVGAGVCRGLPDGDPLATECFELAPNEAIYGFGEKFIRLNKVGQTIDLDMGEALGTTTPRSYKNTPFFVSSKGYGVFLNHSSRISAWVGSMSAVGLQLACEDDFLDYFVMAGSIKQVLSQYTDVTGKGRVPPLWSFGFWQSKISYQSADEVLDVARKLREHEVPCDVINLDTHWFERDWFCNLEFSKERFPDPEAFIDELARMGFKVCLWQLPYIPEGSALFDELRAVDGFVKDRSGAPYNVGICYAAEPGQAYQGFVGCIDYTNPAAIEVHQKWFRKLFGLGAKVIKVDFGEQAPADGVYHDGTPGHQAHNLYPLLYNKAVFEVTEEATGEGIIWARSTWAGSQRYPLHWGGDNTPNFENIIPQLEGGLSLGLSGFQFWSQDIGGFIGLTTDRLLIRWMQFGVLLSHSRIHGMGDREIYKFEPETLRICRDYLRLRYRLLPYLHGTAIDCVKRSLPMARALVVEFQDDRNVHAISDQYLLGDSLMVAPIYDESDRRMVYLPAGLWTDWWTGERMEGNRWIEVEADIETIPLYVREGAIIPMGPVTNYVGEVETKEILLKVSLFAFDGKSSFTVPAGGEEFEVEYFARGDGHTLFIGETAVSIKVEVLGGNEENLEVKYV